MVVVFQPHGTDLNRRARLTERVGDGQQTGDKKIAEFCVAGLHSRRFVPLKATSLPQAAYDNVGVGIRSALADVRPT